MDGVRPAADRRGGAARSGVAASALRYYEEQGLVGVDPDAPAGRAGTRAACCAGSPSSGPRRTWACRSTRSATALATLPEGRPPTKADWARLSRGWRDAARRADRRARGAARRPDVLHRLRLPVAARLRPDEPRRSRLGPRPGGPLPARRAQEGPAGATGERPRRDRRRRGPQRAGRGDHAGRGRPLGAGAGGRRDARRRLPLGGADPAGLRPRRLLGGPPAGGRLALLPVAPAGRARAWSWCTPRRRSPTRWTTAAPCRWSAPSTRPAERPRPRRRRLPRPVGAAGARRRGADRRRPRAAAAAAAPPARARALRPARAALGGRAWGGGSRASGRGRCWRAWPRTRSGRSTRR